MCCCSETTSVTEIGPYRVPEGIVVWPMIYALQNSINNWEDPEDFNPVSHCQTAAWPYSMAAAQHGCHTLGLVTRRVSTTA